MSDPIDSELTGRRESARVLLIDTRDRLLLFRWVDPRLTIPHVWITPGGGVEPGEHLEQAALRELREETGLAGVPLGPRVWERYARFEFDGRPLESVEHFFVARVERYELDLSGMQPGEADYMERAHWWSAAELVAARDEIFAPNDMATLVPPLIAGDYPATPLRLGL
ncbi:MAG: NUDIX domain-containing protein [Chloroflexi bacterium]|nr:NUDIX domain-containing protein [Chloroflexota bacterium]MDA1002884.1 NUDIX domain-containing protein [Chloroflexota bacterium]